MLSFPLTRAGEAALMPGWASSPRVWVARGPLRSPLAPGAPCLPQPMPQGEGDASESHAIWHTFLELAFFGVMAGLKVEKMSCASRCCRWHALGKHLGTGEMLLVGGRAEQQDTWQLAGSSPGAGVQSPGRGLAAALKSWRVLGVIAAEIVRCA